MDQREATEPAAEELSEQRLEEIRRRRFQERVERVLEVMRRERVDWRGLPFIGADGRIGVRVVPVELPASGAEGQT
jgi:anaerobic ribonucleoside-triphosphate reductase